MRWIAAPLAMSMLCLASCDKQQSTVSREVWPTELESMKSMELGELVLLLMPDANEESVGWDHRANSTIHWKTNGYQDNSSPAQLSFMREGIVRANIQGVTATMLRQRVVELSWHVTYWSNGLAKFGPREIWIQPGGPDSTTDNTTCFGQGFTGCEFDEPFASLVSAGIQIKTLCSQAERASQISAFRLTHDGRRPTVLVWEKSEGSGGGSSSLNIELIAKTDDREICAKLLASPTL